MKDCACVLQQVASLDIFIPLCYMKYTDFKISSQLQPGKDPELGL